MSKNEVLLVLLDGVTTKMIVNFAPVYFSNLEKELSTNFIQANIGALFNGENKTNWILIAYDPIATGHLIYNPGPRMQTWQMSRWGR